MLFNLADPVIEGSLLGAAFAVIGSAIIILVQRKTDKEHLGHQQTQLLNERFTAASAQLGNDQPAVRVAGVYALAALADDFTKKQEWLRCQQCIDVMCGFLRLPEKQGTRPWTHQRNQEVRHTILRTIRDHLGNGAETSWRRYEFDFSGVIFEGGELSGARFKQKVKFTKAKFISRPGELPFRFYDVHFLPGAKVDFGYAEFSGDRADFGNVHFLADEVNFGGASFLADEINFGGGQFGGGSVDFGGAVFGRGSIVRFEAAQFTGATVKFNDARFEGATVTFRQARFEAGKVDFSNVGLPWDTPEFDDDPNVAVVLLPEQTPATY